MTQKKKIILVGLGSPKSPDVSDVRVYLKEFLSDPHVVDLNPFLWKIILNLFVLPTRPKSSAELYSRIWDGKEFPLIKYTRALAEKVADELRQYEIEVQEAYILSSPRLTNFKTEIEAGALVVPLFPQYSDSTIGSIKGVIENHMGIKNYRIIEQWHCSEAFVKNTSDLIQHYLDQNQDIDKLLLSFHGIPKRWVLFKGDPYYKHCCETYALIKSRLKTNVPIEMVFQSRFGSEEWLTPYTDERVEQLIGEGDKKIAVHCPAFVTDCLETIDEIGHELRKTAKEAGGEILFIPCLNDNDIFAKDLSYYLKGRFENEGCQECPKEALKEVAMPEQKMESPPLSDHAKSTLKIVFLTLFLDLVGFSIIFPLFPSMAEYYLRIDGDNYLLRLIFDSINNFTQSTGGSFSSIVLFGGALGALYSLLQFIAAPIWGTLSDRHGRRPILIVSVSCLALSYLLWFFSGSFTLLVLARFIGGIMGGNISAATAVVADVTVKENRAKGMATIGIAFALGFIIGPALGGILSLINLTDYFPSWETYGVNPFSMPAALAFLLSIYNVYFLINKFKETLPPEKRGNSESERSLNPLKLFKPLPYPGINGTNFGHFLFLTSFSGMEFTLTFLAVERLGYTSMQNAYMFIFIGVIIALVQGGYVRRKAGEVGEKKMAYRGILMTLPGLFIIGLATNSPALYLGLFFLAVGSSMAIPCMTSLVSLYTPPEQQGKSVGIFRSLGALARVIGPMAASLIFWKWGSKYPYLIGASFLILPLIMIFRLPNPRAQN